MSSFVGSNSSARPLRATRAKNIQWALFASYRQECAGNGLPLRPMSMLSGDASQAMGAGWGKRRNPIFGQRSRGATTIFGVSGTTRDRYGTVLPDATVILFLTATDQKMDKTVSDADGQFLVRSPYYPDPHYLVFYKTGSPDVFASSVNTIILS